MTPRWPIDEVGLEELELDLENVRIPDSHRHQAAIASYMAEAEDLLDLARDILRDGYLDNELPVVVNENGQLIVLEGNRRITALKALRDPSLLGAHASRMERLLSRYPDADKPSQVRVMIAPSRDAAQQMLARLHTRNPKKSWLREQQAIFYHAQLSHTVSVDDLRTRYPSEASSITSFIRMGEMRSVIRGLRYEDRELEQFVKSSKLKMTSFEYAYDLPKIQQALGLSFTKDGFLKSKRIGKAQARGLIYLLGRFKDGTLNTRSPELKAKNSAHDPFVEHLRRVVAGEAGPAAESLDDEDDKPTGEAPPRQGSPGSGNGARAAGDSGAGSDGSHAGQAAESGTASPANSRGPNRGDTRTRLNMGEFVYKGASDGLRRRFEELRRLEVRDFPNAAYDLLRTVLECAIKDYFRTTGRPLQPGKTLGACIEELAKAFQGNQRMTVLINAINRKGRMPASQYSGTEQSLNASNHEPDAFASALEVHEAWGRMKPILAEIVGK